MALIETRVGATSPAEKTQVAQKPISTPQRESTQKNLSFWQTLCLMPNAYRFTEEFPELRRRMLGVFLIYVAIASTDTLLLIPGKYLVDAMHDMVSPEVFVRNVLVLTIVIFTVSKIAAPLTRYIVWECFLQAPLRKGLEKSLILSIIKHPDLTRSNTESADILALIQIGIEQIMNVLESLTREPAFFIRGVVICYLVVYSMLSKEAYWILTLVSFGVTAYGILTITLSGYLSCYADKRESARRARSAATNLVVREVLDLPVAKSSVLDLMCPVKGIDVSEKTLSPELEKVWCDAWDTFETTQRKYEWRNSLLDIGLREGLLLLIQFAILYAVFSWYAPNGIFSYGDAFLYAGLVNQAADPWRMVVTAQKVLLPRGKIHHRI